ncbi:HlpA protein [Synergistales bacterium]|nr:HlpA protein [Synergistales bacterium]GHV45763.1 HlpA protein [Synergistales bacterium]
MKKILVFGALAVLAVLCMSVVAEAADTIGIIDSQGIVSKHPGFEAATKELQQIARQKESEAKAAADKETDVSKKSQLVQAKRMELARDEQRLMEPIFKDCQEAVRVVAKNKKITLVLEKASVYFGGQDITEDVIQQIKLAKTK